MPAYSAATLPCISPNSGGAKGVPRGLQRMNVDEEVLDGSTTEIRICHG